MPELPEVETIRRDLQHSIVNSRISSVAVLDARVLRQPVDDFVSRLKGKKILRIDRRGKALIFVLSENEFLVVQVMMTGQLIVDGKEDKPAYQTDKHTRIRFKLDKGVLLYNDQRVFGQLRVVNDLGTIKHFSLLGPEPFDDGFDRAYIKVFLKRTMRPIKSILLDHGFVAGIGNIYASEILFRSGISPMRAGNKVEQSEISTLLKITRQVLQQAIDLRGSSMRNYRDGAGQKGNFNKAIQVYARANQPCLVCKAPIIRLVQGGRSTFYCRKCQK